MRSWLNTALRMASALIFREARVSEAALLSGLAFRSKAHWGYSTEFMHACREELSVSVRTIEDQQVPVIAAVDQQNIVGFYILENLSHRQVALGAHRLVIQSDPHALGFYPAAGASVVGEMESGSFAERLLPLLEIRLDAFDSAHRIQRQGDTSHAS